ncbi:hypothetical protein ACFOON_07575 [Novosphingobium piscinae]|uniref:hypothetical protein n=1 Tax=Novosphingobium piscinae TaxID=1507448 RepID=UPI001FE7FC55|nr:hypothetical protein [Novosphingobium piscinae]
MDGFRRLEALGLDRKWLLEEERAIHFPTTNTGARRRVIGAAAVEGLRAQPDTGSQYFSPADWGDGTSSAWFACSTESAGTLVSKM